MEKVSPDCCASEKRKDSGTGPEKLVHELAVKCQQPLPSPACLLELGLLATETVKGIHVVTVWP